MHVWERPQVYAPMGVGAYPVDPRSVHDESQKVLDRAVSEARALVPGVTVHERLEEGGPGTVLVDATPHADLLVVGSRGAAGSARCSSGPSANRWRTTPPARS